jgi:hypothetical protein
MVGEVQISEVLDEVGVPLDGEGHGYRTDPVPPRGGGGAQRDTRYALILKERLDLDEK